MQKEHTSSAKNGNHFEIFVQVLKISKKNENIGVTP